MSGGHHHHQHHQRSASSLGPSPPSALPFHDPADAFLREMGELKRSIANEIVLESALHVTSVTAGQCFAAAGQLYGAAPALNALTSQAVPAQEQQLLGLMPSSRLQQQMSEQALDDRKELAVCLATPAEPVEERESEVRVASGSARLAARLAADAAGEERARWVGGT
jgi:hypothetical protein